MAGEVVALDQLSNKSLDIAEKLNAAIVPGDELTAEEEDIAQLLADHGIVDRYTIVPPGMEREFYGQKGLSGYKTGRKGREALRLRRERDQQLKEQAEKESRKERQDKRRSWMQLFVSHFLSFLAGFLTAPVVLEWIKELLGH